MASAHLVAGNQARAIASGLKASPQKLNLVAETIRGRHVSAALNNLAFMKQKVAKDVAKALSSAVANAENNHQLDIDNLFVKEAFVGKSMTLRRFHARGRGRGARVEKHYSQITVVVEEREAA
jgi:large subunit ribosomal protein L22